MPRKCIVLGLPTFGMVSTRWAVAFRCLQAPMNAYFPHLVRWGMAIDEARNSIVAQALAENDDASHLFFLDDDILPHPCCLLQLLKSKKPITCGVYYLKTEFPIPLLFDAPGNGLIDFIPGAGLRRIYSAAAGLSCTEMQVFRDMQEKLDLGTDAMGNPRWFRTMGDEPNESHCSEDAYFFMNANKLGIEVWADMSPYAFGWHWNCLEETAYPKAQWEQFVRTGSATWETPGNGETETVTIKFQ
jgi:hypothetical protein